MKRKGNLYQDICKFENIMKSFDTVCKNTKNKRKVANFKSFKVIYVSQIYKMLKNKTYRVSKYNIFKIYEPKERVIVSLNMYDKVVNNLVSKYILEPALLPCLIDANVASRRNMGTKKGLELRKKFDQSFNTKYYILKCDVSKYFASIDKTILKQKIRKRIKDQDALNIIDIIIDSYDCGLCIGSNTSQILAVFYLNDLDHYIKEVLKIKCYVRFQDDFLLYHESKEYLKYCLEKIKEFLKKEKLSLNKKTRIYSNKNNFVFLGRTKGGNYANYRKINKKLKLKLNEYNNGKIPLYSYVSSVQTQNSLNSPL